MKLTALVIDDEPLAREELEHTLEEIEGVEVIGTCANGVEGIRAIHEHAPDLIFLDVQMPGLDSFEMLSLVDPSKMPMVVFVTAFDEHAVRAFEEEAHDFIVKPARRDRLEKAIRRAQHRQQQKRGPETRSPPILRIPCRTREKILLVAPDSILAAYTDLTGAHLITEAGLRDTDLTLRTLEEKVGLFRCHKQHVVALTAVEEITVLENGSAELRLQGGQTIPVARRYLRKLKETLGLV